MICIGISLTGFLIEKTEKNLFANPNQMHSHFLLVMLKIVANYVLIWHHFISLNILIEREILGCRYKWLHNHFLFDGFFLHLILCQQFFYSTPIQNTTKNWNHFICPLFLVSIVRKKKHETNFDVNKSAEQALSEEKKKLFHAKLVYSFLFPKKEAEKRIVWMIFRFSVFDAFKITIY